VRARKEETAAPPKDQPSVGSEVVDVLTQRGAVRAGERAKDTIRRVSAQEKQMLDEVTQDADTPKK
jgi:hypothetical protein